MVHVRGNKQPRHRRGDGSGALEGAVTIAQVDRDPIRRGAERSEVQLAVVIEVADDIYGGGQQEGRTVGAVSCRWVELDSEVAVDVPLGHNVFASVAVEVSMRIDAERRGGLLNLVRLEGELGESSDRQQGTSSEQAGSLAH